MNYYNEYDKKAAAWLRELIKVGAIPDGHVDERSIVDVQPGDLAGYTQCHFFAGIGGWSYALQLAGWPSDVPVWTGSCPCQPFSVAGKGLGTKDERHLWPVFAELIRQRQPPTVFGEQVASKAGRNWLAGVFADLEGMAYQRAGADLCAAGVGAPHIRQRLYWMAHSRHLCGRDRPISSQQEHDETARCGDGLDNSKCEGSQRLGVTGSVNTSDGISGRFGKSSEASSEVSNRMGFSNRDGCEPGCSTATSSRYRDSVISTSGWTDSRIIFCRDGKNRRIPTEPAFFPLAHGLPARVVRLRGYGNAIVPQCAQAFIEAFLDIQNENMHKM